MLELIDVVELATCELTTIRLDWIDFVHWKYPTYRSNCRVIVVIAISVFRVILVGVLNKNEGMRIDWLILSTADKSVVYIQVSETSETLLKPAVY